MNNNKKQGISLTIALSLVIFVCLSLTMLIVSSVLIFLVRNNIYTINTNKSIVEPLIINLALISVLLGAFCAFLISTIALRPINRYIHALNRLSKGDFKVRLKASGITAYIPVFNDLADSFNHLAEELDKTEVLRSDFINNFSHEFKTPIVSIAGFAKLLKKTNVDEETKIEYLDIIEKESLRLSSMATNVLNLTKIENQTILTETQEFNLSEQIRNSVLLLESKWSKKNIEPELLFNEYNIIANESLLNQVWINLIDNAIKYSFENSKITINITETEKLLLVSIKNIGDTIPESERENIFRKFYQIDKSHSNDGNGIGLAVANGVIKLHNGNITVSSDNQTTVFTVSLPKDLPIS